MDCPSVNFTFYGNGFPPGIIQSFIELPWPIN